MKKELPTNESVYLSPPEKLLEEDPRLRRAWIIAQQAHEGQIRDSGEPYTNHPVEVFNILFVEWQLPYESDLAVAALLHDTVEDTPVTLEMIEEYFGKKAARYVGDVSKFKSEVDDKQTNNSEETTHDQSVERIDKKSLQKIVRGGYLDPNVMLLKLADRLHNMRTLQYVPEAKRKGKADETLEYAAIAESLGIWRVKTDLEDLAFPYTDPTNYRQMSELINNDPRRKDDSERIRSGYVAPVEELLQDAGLTHQIRITPKGVYETYKKRLKGIIRRNISPDGINEINDVVSIRVLLNNSPDCYLTLGIIHDFFGSNVDASRLDEFLVKPRINGYSTIQTMVRTSYGALEYAITTQEKEDFNQWGIISLKRKGASPEELKRYRLKIVFVGDEIVFAPINASVADILYKYNPATAPSAISSLVDDKPKPLTHTVKNGSVLQGVYSDEPRVAPDASLIGKNITPDTAAIIDAQKSAQKTLDLITKGRIIFSEQLRNRGVMDLSDLPLVAEDLIRNFQVDEEIFLTSLEDLYILFAQNVAKPNDDKIEAILDKHEITNNNYATVRVTGKNAPNVLMDITSMVSNMGGDHRSIKLTMRDTSDTYTLRILAAGLNDNNKKELLAYLAKDKRFETVEVV